MDTLFVNASWKQYFLLVAVLLGVFYLILFFLFLLKKRLSHKSTSPSITSRSSNGNPSLQVSPGEISEHGSDAQYSRPPYSDDNWENDDAEDDEGAFDSLEALAAEIEKVLMQGMPRADKEPLLTDLAAVLKLYPQLYKLPFRVAINNVIIKRAKQHCGIDVSDAEVEALWAVA